MAIIIQNPDNVPGAVSTGYQLQNELIYAHIAGFTNVYFSPDYSYMRAGSIFEINGTLVKCQNDESVAGLSTIAKNNYFYIYAGLTNTTTVSLQASITEPIWDIGKCGFYDNNRRALIKMARTMGGLFQRVGFDTTIDSSRLILPSGPGTLIPEADLTGFATIGLTLNTGWYRVVLKAGGGGGGNNNYDTRGLSGKAGGSLGTTENIYFYVPYDGVKAKLMSGAGGSAGKGGKGGGSSVLDIMELGLLYIATGGAGGDTPNHTTPGGNVIGGNTGEPGGTYNDYNGGSAGGGGGGGNLLNGTAGGNNINGILGGGGNAGGIAKKGGDGLAAIYKY